MDHSDVDLDLSAGSGSADHMSASLMGSMARVLGAPPAAGGDQPAHVAGESYLAPTASAGGAGGAGTHSDHVDHTSFPWTMHDGDLRVFQSWDTPAPAASWPPPRPPPHQSVAAGGVASPSSSPAAAQPDAQRPRSFPRRRTQHTHAGTPRGSPRRGKAKGLGSAPARASGRFSPVKDKRDSLVCYPRHAVLGSPTLVRPRPTGLCRSFCVATGAFTQQEGQLRRSLQQLNRAIDELAATVATGAGATRQAPAPVRAPTHRDDIPFGDRSDVVETAVNQATGRTLRTQVLREAVALRHHVLLHSLRLGEAWADVRHASTESPTASPGHGAGADWGGGGVSGAAALLHARSLDLRGREALDACECCVGEQDRDVRQAAWQCLEQLQGLVVSQVQLCRWAKQVEFVERSELLAICKGWRPEGEEAASVTYTRTALESAGR